MVLFLVLLLPLFEQYLHQTNSFTGTINSSNDDSRRIGSTDGNAASLKVKAISGGRLIMATNDMCQVVGFEKGRKVRPVEGVCTSGSCDRASSCGVWRNLTSSSMVPLFG